VQKITSATRDYYYSSNWQVVEERVSGAAPSCPERQFVWGLRYADDLVLRDRVSSQSSSSGTCQPFDERLYVLHDYFNATAVVNTSGTVLERYGYDAYGTVRFMDGSFNSRSGSSYGWETLFGDYRWDSDTGLYQVRNRYLHPKLGIWLVRDPAEYQNGLNLYAYVNDSPLNFVDPLGLIHGPPPPPCQCLAIGFCFLIEQVIDDEGDAGDACCPAGYFTLTCVYTCYVLLSGPAPGCNGPDTFPGSGTYKFCKTSSPPACPTIRFFLGYVDPPEEN